MQKWEYLVITGIHTSIATSGTNWHTLYPRCYRMTVSGLEMVTDFQDFKRRGISELTAVAQFIAQLGDDGWELVGTGYAGTSTLQNSPHQSLYFKRPKP